MNMWLGNDLMAVIPGLTGPMAGIAVDDMAMDGVAMEGDMMMDPGMMGEETGVKDPLLSNWFFVGGISAVTFTAAVLLGLLWAKRKIKKGIDLYED